jgi:hypothetical protein
MKDNNNNNNNKSGRAVKNDKDLGEKKIDAGKGKNRRGNDKMLKIITIITAASIKMIIMVEKPSGRGEKMAKLKRRLETKKGR